MLARRFRSLKYKCSVLCQSWIIHVNTYRCTQTPARTTLLMPWIIQTLRTRENRQTIKLCRLFPNNKPSHNIKKKTLINTLRCQPPLFKGPKPKWKFKPSHNATPKLFPGTVMCLRGLIGSNYTRVSKRNNDTCAPWCRPGVLPVITWFSGFAGWGKSIKNKSLRSRLAPVTPPPPQPPSSSIFVVTPSLSSSNLRSSRIHPGVLK